MTFSVNLTVTVSYLENHISTQEMFNINNSRAENFILIPLLHWSKRCRPRGSQNLTEKIRDRICKFTRIENHEIANVVPILCSVEHSC